MSQDKKPAGIEGLALLPGRGFRKHSQMTTRKKKYVRVKFPALCLWLATAFTFFPCTHSVFFAYVAPEPLNWPAEESSPHIPTTD